MWSSIEVPLPGKDEDEGESKEREGDHTGESKEKVITHRHHSQVLAGHSMLLFFQSQSQTRLLTEGGPASDLATVFGSEDDVVVNVVEV